jgi:flagellar biogenesis protein FliO
MEVSDGIQTQNSEQKVRLTTRGISGFAISDANLKAVSWFGILILFGFGIFMVVKMLRNEIMKRRGLAIPDRQFITIDLNS